MESVLGVARQSGKRPSILCEMCTLETSPRLDGARPQRIFCVRLGADFRKPEQTGAVIPFTNYRSSAWKGMWILCPDNRYEDLRSTIQTVKYLLQSEGVHPGTRKQAEDLLRHLEGELAKLPVKVGTIANSKQRRSKLPPTQLPPK